ncbi:hypothetical protein [Staphylococcus equorum]|uniref:hypothetical protein n=1 Tax=Staphylococcus equorum TaxID=246432 RepID=UPI002DBA7092|nr:hypothetical protein [Staphylococcus equorum]
MKKLLFLLIASFLVLAACGNEESKSEDKKETATKDDSKDKDDEPEKQETEAENNPNEDFTWAEAQEEGEDIQDPSEDDGVTTWGDEDPNNLDEVPEGELSNNFSLDVSVYMENVTSTYEEIVLFEEAEDDVDAEIALEDARYQQEIMESNLSDMPTRNEREKAVKEDLVKINELTVSALDNLEVGFTTEDEEKINVATGEMNEVISLVENLDVE